ncbi:SDR family NAD(P)-dependent oxidoreductase [Spirosoma endbachense]|uniref:Glucose 1-dehydrogenase n=1 Tax=Spirosoma endbachense TaxID=2666025 RepID=A0A6P1VXA9_9BACT|nr:glucose 1-dehydrogenase [Spirosoma endbachense]QHV97395.1 glucose 1-dehydrogenase [Spirosoma endbachense]
MLRLDQKVALITGGGSGIGRAISALFAQQGATVFILDIDEDGATETLQSIVAIKGKAFFKKCSVHNESEVRLVVESIIDQVGRLDIIINNAGIAHIGNAETTRSADMERLLAVNVKGVFYVIQAALPHLKKVRGVILNMASVAATVGLADRFAYSMTKGAVVGMTLSVAKDYLADGIRCNCISPGRVHTPFVDGFLAKTYPGREQEMFEKLSKTQPIGRMGTSEEIASLALYLCSEEAAFITGSDYTIDGGLTRLNS